MESFLAAQSLFLVLVAIATFVAILAGRLRLPYTVSLVLVGLLIAFLQPFAVEVTPELILFIFVPPLIFEAAFHLDFRLLRSAITPVLTLAVPGVLLSTLLIGGLVSLGTGLPLTTTAVFGALIAATDPVAVVALFRALGVPHRLAVVVEGESLFNDGTAIVIFQIALAAALSGVFDPLVGLLDFLRIALGGVAIGLILGWLVAQFIARVDDRFIVSTLTTLLAYGAYLAAERMHVSGVLAVVVAGLLSGNMGLVNASPTSKVMLFNLWEYLAFLANSLVFLLIGINVDLQHLWLNLRPIAIAVVAVLIGRAVVVYGLTWIVHLGRKSSPLPLVWRHVLFWGGLRGAISLALALSLPMTLAQREVLESMAFGVVLFTLLAQGTTIRFLLKRWGLIERPPYRIDQERRLGRLFATRAGLRQLEQLHDEGLLTDEMWLGLREEYQQVRQRLAQDLNRLFYEHASLEREMLIQARREALRAERGALNDALRRGMISEVVYEELKAEIDSRLEALNLIQAALQGRWAETGAD
ncbi:MAG: Na+/H+ antiporter [Chloroflexi bacterium]|nr:MAG: Na+/H+ antiporter [Chloroflexota bacterium]